MNNDFERMIVKSFNDYFTENHIRGISHRLKQHRFTPQFMDILVDSLNPDYYLGIECKSISVEKGAKALYFTQHFTEDKNGVHQIERISGFLELSGRRGFLAVELRFGAGHGRKAYAIPWPVLQERYKTELKFTIEEISQFPEITRSGGRYRVTPDVWQYDRT
ncbi:hypothetical protein J5839_00440 [Methanosarcinaceae archaeon]|nr:hypothetical protein [Methanosarcinaceae archaeon]MBQ3620151.1 hypothetical protein [Methanosarcinaceae archaeon]